MKKLLFAVLVILMLTAGCVQMDKATQERLQEMFGEQFETFIQDFRQALTGQPPTAYIDSISPTAVPAGGTVYFDGHGTDVDGDVVAYSWRSSIDGDLSTTASFETSSLSAGVHTIYLSVQDDDGDWSEEVESSVTVSTEAAAPASAPTINSFTASPGSITSGEFSTLTWNVFGAATVSIDHAIGDVALAGTRTVSPGTTTTYTLTATNEADTVTARARVTVSGVPTPPPPPPSVSPPFISFFTANPGSITTGNSSMLSWLVSHADTVTISYGSSVTPVSPVGSATATPTTTTTYTLTATNTAGSVTETVQVVVSGAPPPSLPVISFFTASPGSITLGASSTLSWSVSGAPIISINQGVGGVTPSGTRVVSPTATTTYTLTATNATGTVTQPVQVVVSGGGGGGSALEQALFDEVNSRRIGAGFLPLIRNPYLDQLARQHAQDMPTQSAPHEGFSSRFTLAQTNIGATTMGENELNYPDPSSASQMADGWQSSPGHWANIINPAFTRSGMGIYTSGGRIYATQIFTN